MSSILTKGQRGLLRVLLALGGFMAANSIYLRLSPPRGESLPAFYQWMLLGHIYVGLLLLVPMVAFILWHFTVVLRRRHAFAVWTGIAIAAAGVALAVSGLVIRTEANTEANAWVYGLHVVLGLAMPAAYILHRVSAEQRPTKRGMLGGLGALAGVVALFTGVHAATAPEPRPDPPGFSRLRAPGAPGEDPFVPFDHPSRIVAEADPSSFFFPSPSWTRPSDAPPGSPVSYAAVTNGDVPDPEAMKREIREKGFVSEGVIGADTCARCHPDAAAQWKSSAHRFSSFNNPFYRATIEDMRREERGFEKSKWCAGCHDPAVLFPGKMDRPFDAELPDAQAGLTCLACHAIDSIHSVAGNGDYTLADRTRTQYLFSGVKDGPGAALHDLLVKAKPEVHKRDMLRPFMRTSEFCGVCHKVSLQEPVNDYRWFRGQNDYDSWHDSGIARNNPQTFYLPPGVRSCQDCHMPLEDAPLGDVAAKDGKIRSHRFLGPNTALPHVRGDTDMLDRIRKFREGALRVDVFALRRPDEGPPPGRLDTGLAFDPAPVRAGETVELQVVVRNLNVGHIFPAGTLDSNQGWLELEILGPDGTVLRRSGFLHEDGALSADAHTYGATVVDRHGRRIDRRNAKDIYVPAQVNVIPPGAADLVRYELAVPEEWAGMTLAARATLKWRKFRHDYTKFAFESLGLPVPRLPVDVLAVGEARLPVIPGDAPLPPPAERSSFGEGDWMRWNDLGIGAFRQGDTVLAARAFEIVRRAAPKLPDGPRNLARLLLMDGKLEDAKALLREADALAPGDPRVAWWLGLAHSRTADYDRALEAFERTLQVFPGDRNTHAEKARVLYLTGRYEESLAAWLQVLHIDPENIDAHENRVRIYGLLGREKEAAAAQAAADRYRVDPSARERTLEYLRSHDDVNREAQPIHVHELRR